MELHESIQEMFDAGYKVAKIQRLMGFGHHSSVTRVRDRYNLEDYTAFDEYDYKYKTTPYIGFNTDWEESFIDEVVRESFLFDNFQIPVNLSDEWNDVSLFIQKKYGSIVGYLTEKDLVPLMDCIEKNCRNCGYKPVSQFRERSGHMGLESICKSCDKERLKVYIENNKEMMNEKSRQWCRENREEVYAYQKSWRMMNPEKTNKYSIENTARRRAIDYSHGWDFTIKENKSIHGTKCLLTGSDDIAYDHFIPLIWRHAGSYNNNMYPLDKRINSSKWSHNPFDWFEENHERLGIKREKFDALIDKLAEMNEMTVDEFTDYVDWCDENKRTQEECDADTRPSVEIWREVTRKETKL